MIGLVEAPEEIPIILRLRYIVNATHDKEHDVVYASAAVIEDDICSVYFIRCLSEFTEVVVPVV